MKPLKRRSPLPAAIEPLEARISPAAVVSVVAGNLNVVDGNNGNDDITFSLNGANFRFVDPSGITAGAGATQVNSTTVDVASSGISGRVNILGNGGFDTVTIAAGLPLLAGLTVQTEVLATLPSLSVGTLGLDLTATASGITQTGPVFVNGGASFSGGPNAITLTHSANDFSGPVTLNNSGTNDVTIVDANGILIGGASVGGGAFSVTALAGDLQLQTSGVVVFGGDLNFSARGGGSIALNGTFTQIGAGNADIKFNAEENIMFNNGSRVTVSSGASNIFLAADAESAPNQSGFIFIDPTAVLTSNGGDITLGGGANPALAPAFGNAIQKSGIEIRGSLDAGTGAIVLNGHGFDNAATDSSNGVWIAGGSVSTTDGNISIVGTAGSGSGNLHIGVDVAGGTVASLNNGAINITGSAAGTGINESGVRVALNGVVKSNGAIINITGTGSASGSGNQNIGLLMDAGSTIASSVGAIHVVAIAGNVSPAFQMSNISGAGANRLGFDGAVPFTGDILLALQEFAVANDAINLLNGSIASTGGTLTIRSLSGSAAIGIAGAAGTIRLSASEIATFSDGFSAIILGGDTSFGTITSNAATFLDPLTLRAPGGGDIVLNGTLTAGANPISLDAGSASIQINSGTFTLAASDVLADTSSVVLNGGTLALGAFTDAVASVTLNSGSITGTTGTLAAFSTFTVQTGTISAALAGSGVSLTKNGPGTVTLSGIAANTFDGGTFINGGTLILQKTSGVDAIPGDVLIGDAVGNDVLQLGASDQINDGSVIVFNSGGVGNHAKFTLAGFNETLKGVRTLTSGALPIISTFETGGTPVTSTLTLNSAPDYTFDGIIRNNGGGSAKGTLALVKTGAGMLTLANTENSTFNGAGISYTGATTLTDGRILLLNLASFASPVAITSSASNGLTFNQSTRSLSMSAALSGTGSVAKFGTGALTIAGPETYGSLFVAQGAVTLTTAPANAVITNSLGALTINGGAANSTILHNGGTLTINANLTNASLVVNAATAISTSQTLTSLDIGDSAVVTLLAHSGGAANVRVIDTAALVFGGTANGHLDLANNALIVRGSSLAAVTANVATGFNGGAWDGTGISSTSAASDPLGTGALGVVDNDDTGYTQFAGVSVPTTGHVVIVSFTTYGDADLNGTINGLDFGLFDKGFNGGVGGWHNGDFDYNGVVNNDDQSLLVFAFASQSGGGAGGVIFVWNGSASTDWFNSANWTPISGGPGVPGASDTAVLSNAAAPNQPVLDSATSVAVFDHIAGTLGGTGTLTVVSDFTWLGGVEIGLGVTLVSGGGALTVNGSDTKTLDARTLSVAGTSTWNPATHLIFQNAATLKAGTAISAVLDLTLDVNGGVIDTNGNSITFGAGTVVSGAGSLAKIGAGTFTLNGANTYLGATAINGGTLRLGASEVLPDAGDVSLISGTLDLGSFTETIVNLNHNAAGNISASGGTLIATQAASIDGGVVGVNLASPAINFTGNANFQGTLDAGPGAITIGGGLVTLTASKTTISHLTVNGGTLAIGAFTEMFDTVIVNSGTVTSTTGTLAASAALTVNGGVVGAKLQSGVITVNGGAVNGNVDAGQGGAINLNGGVVTIASSNTITSIVTINGGTLALGSRSLSVGGIQLTTGSITGTGTLTSGTDFIATSGSITPKLAGAVGFTQSGPGTVVLGNSQNSFTGDIHINGTLQIASNGALGNSANQIFFNGGTLKTTASITSARNIDKGGTSATFNVAAGTLTLNGTITGAGTLSKTGPGTLLFGSAFIGAASVSAGGGPLVVGGTRATLGGVGDILVNVVDDGMGGTRISTIQLSNTDATTALVVNGPSGLATTTIDKIISADPTREIGSITLGKSVILGNGFSDGPDFEIQGKIGKITVNDVRAGTIFSLGAGLPYNYSPDSTTPDTYNNHPALRIRDVLGDGVEINVLGDGISGDLGGVGGGGLGKVYVRSWPGDGFIRTTQSIESFQLRTGDCKLVFEVDKMHVGTLTMGNVGKMTIAGAWNSSGSEVEGEIGSFTAASFTGAADITAGSIVKMKIRAGNYAGATNVTNASFGKGFTVNGPNNATPGNFLGSLTAAAAVSKINIHGDVKGTINAASIASVTAFSFGEIGTPYTITTSGDLGLIKTSAGGIDDFTFNVGGVFGGINVSEKTASPSAVGIDGVTVNAGTIGKISVKLIETNFSTDLTGIRNSKFESGSSIGKISVSLNSGGTLVGIQGDANPIIGNTVFEAVTSIDTVTSSHSVDRATFAAGTSLANVTIGKGNSGATLTRSYLLGGSYLGGDGVIGMNADTFDRGGTVGNVTVGGAVSATTIAAGVDPVDGVFGNIGDVLASTGVLPAFSIGVLVFGGGSGSVESASFIPFAHNYAIEAASIKSLTVGAGPKISTFNAPTYFEAIANVEAIADILVRKVTV